MGSRETGMPRTNDPMTSRDEQHLPAQDAAAHVRDGDPHVGDADPHGNPASEPVSSEPGQAFVHRPIYPEGKAALHVDPEGATGLCAEHARPYVLAATIIASAMAYIDGTVVHIALPTMQASLGASFEAMQWVVNAYALTLGSLILIGGGAGDRFGRRRLFIAGIAIFALSSLWCAVAPDAATLIAARAVQGIGAALLVPQSLAIIATSFPKEKRGAAIGIWAGASAVTTALGPPIGGLMIDVLDWRAVFWINLPLCALAIWLTAAHVPESRDEAVEAPLDWAGGVAAICAFGFLTAGLTSIGHADGAWLAYLWLGLGLLGLGFFIRFEANTKAPLIPLDLFQQRAFTGANLMTLALYGALGAILFLLPFDLIARRGLSPTEAGLTLLPLGLIIGVLSKRSGDMADRIGTRTLIVGGALVVAGATAVLALSFDSFVFGVLLPLCVIAVGMAGVIAPLTTAVMNAADDARSGAASGVNNAASRLAGLFAVAIAGSLASGVFTGALADSGVSGDARFGVLPTPGDPQRAAMEAAFVSAYGAALWMAAAWAVVAAVLAFFTLPGRPSSDIGGGGSHPRHRRSENAPTPLAH